MTSIKTCHDYKLAEDFLGHTNASAELCFRDKTVSRILQPHSETAVSVLDLKKKKNKKTKKSLHKLTLNLNPENQMHLIIAMSSHRSKKKKKKKKKQASSYKTQRSRDASNPAHFYSLSVSVKDSTEAEPAKHSWAAALEYT